MDHEQPGAGSATPGGAHRRREVRPLAQSVRRRQHRRPQAESSERPLRRRAARMLRPARVRIRRRKPWVLARRRLFGWKVRLLTMFSHLQWWAGWARVVGEPVAFGCHRKPMTFAGKQHPFGCGSRACENSRTTGPLTVRESDHGGQTSRCGTPGWRKRPRIARSTARHPARHTLGDHPAYPQPVDNHVDGVRVDAGRAPMIDPVGIERDGDASGGRDDDPAVAHDPRGPRLRRDPGAAEGVPVARQARRPARRHRPDRGAERLHQGHRRDPAA